MLNKSEINKFYRDKLNEHGASAQGVGWRDKEAQEVRFYQLLKIIPSEGVFTINDLGCGTGDLITSMELMFKGRYNYIGYDALDEMIARSGQRFTEGESMRFLKITDYHQMEVSDYSVASGIFNVRAGIGDDEWQAYILTTITAMFNCSKKGFAFNALTKYSDVERMRPELFYSDPLFLFDYCKRNFSRNVALLHDYDIYDFTILVKKDI